MTLDRDFGTAAMRDGSAFWRLWFRTIDCLRHESATV